MEIKFNRYHCGGNSFVLIDTVQQRIIPYDISEFVVDICNPKTGVGADRAIFLTSTSTDDLYGMHIINQDGSEAEMCGNALRCLGLYMYNGSYLNNLHKTDQLQYQIQTEDGNKKILIKLRDNGGLETIGFEIVPGLIKRLGENIVKVSMGNPHIVFIEKEVDDIVQDLYDQSNIELVQVVSRDHLKVRVFERGVGETTSCGTGACAAFNATYILGLCDEKVVIQYPGEEVEVSWVGNNNTTLELYGKPPRCIINNGTYEC